ncbi:MAG: Uma2 family endonuclease [Polyangiaceae bacterium]|nr:Uma2 family endonuclease [Polyangiaceae bacterium]
MTIDEYVALDRSSEDRWEYVNGEAYAMAGGSPKHALVATNLISMLKTALKGKPCLAFHEAQKIATARTRSYHYPDASVVCPPFACDERDDHAFTSPIALFEVLSPSTRDYDRGGKFVHYRSISELRDYVLIDPDAREVEHRKKVAPDQWLSTFLHEGLLTIMMESSQIALRIESFWEDLERLP